MRVPEDTRGPVLYHKEGQRWAPAAGASRVRVGPGTSDAGLSAQYKSRKAWTAKLKA